VKGTYKVFGFEMLHTSGAQCSLATIDDDSTCGHCTCCQFDAFHTTERTHTTNETK